MLSTSDHVSHISNAVITTKCEAEEKNADRLHTFLTTQWRDCCNYNVSRSFADVSLRWTCSGPFSFLFHLSLALSLSSSLPLFGPRSHTNLPLPEMPWKGVTAFLSSGNICVSLLLLNLRPLFKHTCPNLFHPPSPHTHARTHTRSVALSLHTTPYIYRRVDGKRSVFMACLSETREKRGRQLKLNVAPWWRTRLLQTLCRGFHFKACCTVPGSRRVRKQSDSFGQFLSGMNIFHYVTNQYFQPNSSYLRKKKKKSG